MKEGYFGSKRYQEVIDLIKEKWSTDDLWTGEGAAETFGKKGATNPFEAMVDLYTADEDDAKRGPIIGGDRLSAMTQASPAPQSVTVDSNIRTKALVPESFIHLATQHAIDIHDVEPVGADGLEDKPFGFVELLEDSDWYYYTFDYRSYKNLHPIAQFAQGSVEIGYETWFDMVKASLPLALELLGRRFVKANIAHKGAITGPGQTNREDYYNLIGPKVEEFIKAGYVEFGGYTIETRKDAHAPADKQKLAELKAQRDAIPQPPPPDSLQEAELASINAEIEDIEDNQSMFNPGLTFLIGISKPATLLLLQDADPGANLEVLAPDRAIIMKVGSIDDDLDEIAKTLKVYQQAQKESIPPLEIGPTPAPKGTALGSWDTISLDNEADQIEDFREALKTLLKDATAGGGQGVPSGFFSGDRPTSEAQEEWAKYPETWGKDKNLIEIGITKSNKKLEKIHGPAPDWDIAYVREYAPKTKFNEDSTAPGLIGIQRLGEVEHSRILGGGFNASLEPAFQDFRRTLRRTVTDTERTLYFISTMHKGNSFDVVDDRASRNPKVDFNIDPETARTKLDLLSFIEKYIGPIQHTHKFLHDHPEGTKKAQEQYITNNHGPLASHKSRMSANAMTNDPTWAENYTHYSRKWVRNVADDFWRTLPETRDRLRIEDGPNPVSSIFTRVLSQADVKTLVKQAIKCWLDPNEWLEIACRYAMKEMGADNFFDNISKDGTLTKLIAESTAQVATEVANAAKTIKAQKRVQNAEFQQLMSERDRYNTQIEELTARKVVVESELKNATPGSPEEKNLSKDVKAIDTQIANTIGRRRQVEMDSSYANYVEGSAGTYMPSSYGGVTNAEVAEAASDISKSIMKMTDPNFKKELCRNIISYSANAIDLIQSLIVDPIRKSVNPTPEEVAKKEDEAKRQRKYKEEEAVERPRDKTTTFGSQADEVMRAIGAQIAHAAILYFVKKTLNEVILACQALKNFLWDGLDPKDPGNKNRIPGKASFDDLMDLTPGAAARNLAKKLSAQGVDLTEPDLANNILGLMEALESMLSQAELCALFNNGEATLTVSKIIKNLLMTSFENLYSQLKGNDETLSYKKIKEFFHKSFEGVIDPAYCEEIQKKLPTQLYSECEIPPYVHELCGELLDGHATKEQVENVCNRAKLDRIEKLLNLLDKAYNPESPLAADDCGNPDRIPHDIYPTNLINNTLIDQNLRTIEPGFKSEIFIFHNKLLTGYPSGFPPLDGLTNFESDTPWQNQKQTPGNIPDHALLPIIRESFNAPFQWLPGYSIDNLLSNFILKSPKRRFLWSDPSNPLAVYATDDKLEYYLSVADPGKQIIETDYWVGKDRFFFYNILHNGAPWFDNLEAQIRKYLYLYTENAAKIKEGKIKRGWWAMSPTEQAKQSGIDEAALASDNWFHSPLEQEFFNVLNKKFYPGMYFGQDTEKSLEKMFNIITRDLGNHLLDAFRRSPTFHPDGKEMFRKFFAGLFPREIFPADDLCDIKQVSLLKIEELKQNIRERNEALECEEEPDIDNDTPNLSRSIAEGIIYILARLYTVETFLRLLPVSTMFKVKDVLKSETIINLIVSNMVHELAMLDYQKTFKTTTGDEKENFQTPNEKAGPQRISNPIGGTPWPFSRNVFIDEPATKVIAPKDGADFEPKFQSHVVYYANKILRAKIKEATKRGYKLLDPLTEEPYEYDRNPYSLSGIKYLLKEQIISVSDFMEKEFEARLDIDIKSWKHSFLSSFLWRHLDRDYGYREGQEKSFFGGSDNTDDFFVGDVQSPDPNDNIFNLMPQIAEIDPNYNTEKAGWVAPNPHFLTKPRLYSHFMNRYRIDAKQYITDTWYNLSELYDDPTLGFDAAFGGMSAPLSIINAFWASHGDAGQHRWVDIEYLGTDTVASTLSAISKIGPNGGFILQPYIRAHQHTKIEDPIIKITPTSLDEKKAIALSKLTTIMGWLAFPYAGMSPDEIETPAHENYADTAPSEQLTPAMALVYDEYKKWYGMYTIGTACGAQCVKDHWSAHVKTRAQSEYDDVMNSKAFELDPSVHNDLPLEFGNIWHTPDNLDEKPGAYININQWREAMTADSFGVAKYKNSVQASEPHTNYFDPWMYGLRLVYVLPLRYDYAPVYSGVGPPAIQIDPSTGDTIYLGLEKEPVKRKLNSDDTNKTVKIDLDKLLLPFNTSINGPIEGPNLLNKKAYILYEKLRKAELDTGTYMFVEYESALTTLKEGADISPPIIEIPLMEVELPVGGLNFAETGALHSFYESQAKEQGKSDQDAKTIADGFVKLAQDTKAVPLGYFSYQDSIEDEFPLNKLLGLMTETSDFEKLFGRIFPIDNYKTLISLYVLMQTFELDEYTKTTQAEYDTGNKDSNGLPVYDTETELKGGMFPETKGMLRSLFYSNTQAADPLKGGAEAASQEQTSQTEDTGEDSWWNKFQTLMLGSPPSYSQIFAMTPLGIMKGMVQATDPGWKKCNPFFMTPWTPAGFTMCMLEKYLGDTMSGIWFGNKAPDQLKAAEVKACDSAVDEDPTISKEEYTADEKMFDMLMKSYNIMEDDRNWILRQKYKARNSNSTAFPRDNPGASFDWAYQYRKFSDTALFDTLIAAEKAGEATSDMNLEVIFSTLREYYDTLIEVEGHAFDYIEKYKRVISDLTKNEDYYINNAWVADSMILPGSSQGFLDILYFNCESVNSSPFPVSDTLVDLCDNKATFELARKQILILEGFYNDVLSAGGQQTIPGPSYLPSLSNFQWCIDEACDTWEPVLSRVTFLGEEVSIFEKGDKKLEIQKKLEEITKDSPVVAWVIKFPYTNEDYEGTNCKGNWHHPSAQTREYFRPNFLDGNTLSFVVGQPDGPKHFYEATCDKTLGYIKWKKDDPDSNVHGSTSTKIAVKDMGSSWVYGENTTGAKSGWAFAVDHGSCGELNYLAGSIKKSIEEFITQNNLQDIVTIQWVDRNAEDAGGEWFDGHPLPGRNRGGVELHITGLLTAPAGTLITESGLSPAQLLNAKEKYVEAGGDPDTFDAYGLESTRGRQIAVTHGLDTKIWDPYDVLGTDALC